MSEPANDQTQPGAENVAPQQLRLSPNVLWFGVVSLLTDASGELIYPLIPLFLTSVLGGSVGFVGIIEGVAESTASLFKLISGRIADRVPRKKPLVVFGYGLASLVRPLVAFATAPWMVLLVRFADRVGKGIRSSPRDAMVADVTPRNLRGSAFGYHRSMDNTGAILGPLVGYALMVGLGLPLRSIFLFAAVPGALAVLSLVLGVRETPRKIPDAAKPQDPIASQQADIATQQNNIASATTILDSAVRQRDAERESDRALYRYLAVLGVFTLGNASDAFLLLRAAQVLHPGTPLGSAALADPRILLLWTLHNTVKAVLSYRGGILSDRHGRRIVIAVGWAAYAVVYLAFAFADAAWQMWVLFAAYGLYYSLVEGAEKALVADLAIEGRRGRAFGLYHATIGALSLPASALFGLLYKIAGAPVAFGTAAALAGLAAVLLYTFVRIPRDGEIAPSA